MLKGTELQENSPLYTDLLFWGVGNSNQRQLLKGQGVLKEY